jgi:plasmid stabilization system protein ParE
MTGKYQLSATAIRTLDHEIAYSKRKWGTAHAEQYRRELMETIRKLADNPYLHPEKSELGEGIRCVRFKGNYIVYRLNKHGDGIIITNLPSIYRKTRP